MMQCTKESVRPLPNMGEQLLSLKEHTLDTSTYLNSLANYQEQYTISYDQNLSIEANINYLQRKSHTPENIHKLQQWRKGKEANTACLLEITSFINETRGGIMKQLQVNVTDLNKLQDLILDNFLLQWKKEQQQAGNGSKITMNLDSIQNWCENLAELVWMNRQHLNLMLALTNKIQLENDNYNELLTTLIQWVDNLLRTLISRTFIIENQPPQVMKTNTKFSSSCRLLVGGSLNVHMFTPQVNVTIVGQSQASDFLQHSTSVDMACKKGSGEILNNTCNMQYKQTTRLLIGELRNMQLRKIKRSEKKGTESVMDEKFALLFQTELFLGGGEPPIKVWAVSLPVVVIVHGNQEPHAWATVTWDNAFSSPERTSFAVPDKVPWSEVAETLSCKYESVTGRGLTEDNHHYLAEKAFRTSLATDFSQKKLSWTQFGKDLLPGRAFTFWEWFFAVMKLTKDHLRDYWVEECIEGFIQKQRAEFLLSQKPPGTFIIRYSDSELGGITIAWTGGNSEVFMLQPHTAKDLAQRKLADCLKDLELLLFLYPNRNKDAVFEKHYTPASQVNKGGYVKSELRVVIPTLANIPPDTVSATNQLTSDMEDMAVSLQHIIPTTMNLTSCDFSEDTFSGEPYADFIEIEDFEFEEVFIDALLKPLS